MHNRPITACFDGILNENHFKLEPLNRWPESSVLQIILWNGSNYNASFGLSASVRERLPLQGSTTVHINLESKPFLLMLRTVALAKQWGAEKRKSYTILLCVLRAFTVLFLKEPISAKRVSARVPNIYIKKIKKQAKRTSNYSHLFWQTITFKAIWSTEWTLAANERERRDAKRRKAHFIHRGFILGWYEY